MMLRMITLSLAALTTALVAPPAAAEPQLPDCDIAKLPDPSLIYRDGKFAVRSSKIEGAGGVVLFALAEIPNCGAMMRFTRESFEDRSKFLEDVPNIAARMLGSDTGSFKVTWETNRNGFPLEKWTLGNDRQFLIMAQRMDEAAVYDPARGAICVGFTKLMPVISASNLKSVTPDILDWADAMERLAGVCMADTPKDTFSQAVSKAIEEIHLNMDQRAQRASSPDQTVQNITTGYKAARLTPRPASWPNLEDTAED
jgi:hypothetical protein